ncbi:MAG: fluoride efflux transporter CrcB [Pseudomonadota bacterium]
MTKILLVGMGGFAGSICRYLAGELFQKILAAPFLLHTTLIINVTGCLLIGFLSGLSETRQMFTPEIRVLVVVGFLGGFTTFSTFGYEFFVLAKGGQTLPAMANLFLHITLGIGAVWLGFTISKMI